VSSTKTINGIPFLHMEVFIKMKHVILEGAARDNEGGKAAKKKPAISDGLLYSNW
jgi:hypothetical protein